MKIISPFNDYYDHAVHPSQVDEQIRYVRKTSLVPFDYTGSMGNLRHAKNFSFHQKSTFNNINKSEMISVSEAILTVGRKTYQIVVPSGFALNDLNFQSQSNGIHLKPYGAPTRDAFKKVYLDYLRHNDHTNISFEDQEADDRFYFRRFYRNRNSNKTPFVEGLTNFDATELCLHYQTPVVLIAFMKDLNNIYSNNTLKVILNPPLRSFNMMHVLDPYQAWQEISMWIGGIMPGACSPMVELSNESKIEKAGFDKKISFRTRSSKN